MIGACWLQSYLQEKQESGLGPAPNRQMAVFIKALTTTNKILPANSEDRRVFAQTTFRPHTQAVENCAGGPAALGCGA